MILSKKGNDAYKARKFDEAIDYYSKALNTAPSIDEDCAVFYCNRAACYLFQVCVGSHRMRCKQ